MSLDQLTIGKFSQITRLSQKALRLYDQKGILRPTVKDDLTGYRYYKITQIDLGLKIKYLTWMGFSLAEITEILNAANQGDQTTIQLHFSKRLDDIHEEIDRLQRVEQLLNGTSTIAEIFMNTSPPIIKTVPKTRVIAKRQNGSYNDTINDLISQLMRQIYSPDNRKAFVTINGPVICIEHDKEFKEVDADIEIAIPITGRIVVDKGYEVKNLEECEVVSTIYTGPYEGIHEAYASLFNFATNDELNLIGPARELYLVTPENQKTPEEYVTEVQIPVGKNQDIDN
jgi:effector-binding domain-containing protein